MKFLLKSLLCFSVMALALNSGYGQQKPQYTQYIFSPQLINPAVTGIDNYIDVRLGSRQQWTGLKGAPETNFIAVGIPLKHEYLFGHANSFAEHGENPMSRSYIQDYQAAKAHHGIGLYATRDQTGPLSQTDISLSYAYHIGLSSRINLAAGISAGLAMQRLDHSELISDAGYEPTIDNLYSQTQPVIGAGIWLYGPQFFSGLSFSRLNTGSSSDLSLQNHIFFTSGLKFIIGENFGLLPSTMFKLVDQTVSADFNLKLAFRDKFWVGGSYRVKDSFSPMVGFNISSLFVLSYAYDYTVSSLSAVSGGSHEIVLGLLLNNRYRVTCPRF